MCENQNHRVLVLGTLTCAGWCGVAQTLTLGTSDKSCVVPVPLMSLFRVKIFWLFIVISIDNTCTICTKMVIPNKIGKKVKPVCLGQSFSRVPRVTVGRVDGTFI